MPGERRGWRYPLDALQSQLAGIKLIGSYNRAVPDEVFFGKMPGKVYAQVPFHTVSVFL